VLSIRAGGGTQAGLLPAFWTESRDRGTLDADLRWQAAPGVAVGAQVDALRADRYPDNRHITGPGDVTLRTELRLWQAPVDGGLRWAVKLPDAEDGSQLGTDETDVHMDLELHRDQGPLSLRLAGGVAVLGDPLHATHQVWRPEGQARVDAALGPLVPGLALDSRLGPGPPADTQLHLRLEGACPALVGAEATAGLSAAAPGWGLRAWLGWGWGCHGARAPVDRGETDRGRADRG